jgi:SAM-dependent methyltransferase
MRSAIVSQLPRIPALDDATRRALNALNRSFYREQAARFDETRGHPWPGWEPLRPWLPATDPLRVLDVGCGNGRFGDWLLTVRGRLDYVGIDASAELLATARGRRAAGPEAHFVEADLVTSDLDDVVGDARFDVVACFGLIHHVPGAAHRRRLVRACGERLAASGILVFTCWQFEAFERFRKRIVPWDRAEHGVDPARLEAGDHLLRWGDGAAARYCHFTDDAEFDDLAAAAAEAAAGTLAARYRADGREGGLNRYAVVRAGP